ncbi:GNAT family N-acetyltransferase [Lacicoccus alkaliphilus]|uniref:Predicted acetyltransferase, GNAT superfamily n=1 Tax=Lacicoccus alkaliphilus DSM 16010 TaxID=1123231 RepID=A0A1M7KQ47_9BACL|nr:GNAT family N-acetyltransferase [Salinicoccus alkaliphilus]SHM67117.1 Predicted acetyltransferase, GNAT superfamily [Salinicoccus alkaliphilus DSM 16010]
MVVIKELNTMEELAMVHDIEHQIWEQHPVPLHQTFTAVKNGGIMLAAFEGGEVAGFSYGFAGFRDGKAYLCSHMLGIRPGLRSRKIGEQLKWQQREVAMRKGYDLIRWTFDPLETRNAYLNLTKLNATCNTYVENCYGEMKDGINKGLPSDRFEVFWHLDSPHVTRRRSMNVEGAVALNTVKEIGKGCLAYCGREVVELEAPVYSLAVPKEFQQLKAADPDLALEWRMKTRERFKALFAAGYAAVRITPYEKHAEYIFIRKDGLKLQG